MTCGWLYSSRNSSDCGVLREYTRKITLHLSLLDSGYLSSVPRLKVIIIIIIIIVVVVVVIHSVVVKALFYKPEGRGFETR
jgi:carbon starvation protein CstA